jgi:hypothetical protein
MGRTKEMVVAMYGEWMPMLPNLAGRYMRSIACMGWELGWRGSRLRLIIVVGVCGGWVEFHGSWVMVTVSARLGTGAGGGSSSGGWVNILGEAAEKGLGVGVKRVGKGRGPLGQGSGMDDRNYTAMRTHVQRSVHLSALLIT